MSLAPKTIEGTWEDVLKHAHELAGHRLRVTVMDNASAPAESLQDADMWVRSLYEWAQNRPSVPTVLDDSRESIYVDRLDRQ